MNFPVNFTDSSMSINNNNHPASILNIHKQKAQRFTRAWISQIEIELSTLELAFPEMRIFTSLRCFSHKSRSNRWDKNHPETSLFKCRGGAFEFNFFPSFSRSRQRNLHLCRLMALKVKNPLSVLNFNFLCARSDCESDQTNKAGWWFDRITATECAIRLSFTVLGMKFADKKKSLLIQFAFDAQLTIQCSVFCPSALCSRPLMKPTIN